MEEGRKAQGKKRPCVSASTATTGRKAQVKGKRPCVVGNPSTGYAHHSYMIEEEELDIDPDLFWFQKPGVVSAYRASGPEEGEEEPPGGPYFMNLSDYESEYGHAHAVKTVYHWEGPMDERGRVVEKVPWWAREEARERAKMLRADPPKTRPQTVATLK